MSRDREDNWPMQEKRPVKKEYMAPEFVEYGEVVDLTRAT